MPTNDAVRDGEDLYLFSRRHGFHSIEQVLAANLDTLRDREQGVLRTGETLVVPDLQPYTAICATGRRHVFIRRNMVMPLRLLILDDDGEPFDGGTYTLELEGVAPGEETQFQDVTDDEGYVDLVIPVARSATLKLYEGEAVVMEIPLSFGKLEPIGTVLGVKRRLANLGFPVDDLADAQNWSEQTNESLLRFIVDQGAQVQEAFAVPQNQEAMAFVRRRLLAVHDGIEG